MSDQQTTSTTTISSKETVMDNQNATEQTAVEEPQNASQNASQSASQDAQQAQPAEPREEATEATEATEDQGQDEQEPRGAEAKKYRLRLREAEAERDQLRETLTGVQADLVTRTVTEVEVAFPPRPGASFTTSGKLRHASDLFTMTGTTAADYLGDDGKPHQGRISEAVARLLHDRPDLRAGYGMFAPIPGQEKSPSGDGIPPGANAFEDAFRANMNR